MASIQHSFHKLLWSRLVWTSKIMSKQTTDPGSGPWMLLNIQHKAVSHVSKEGVLLKKQTKWYLVFSWQTVLMEIREWLDAHPKEVVILSFSHFLALTQELHVLLLTTIRNIFTVKLCPKTVQLLLQLTRIGLEIYLSFSTQPIKITKPRNYLCSQNLICIYSKWVSVLLKDTSTCGWKEPASDIHNPFSPLGLHVWFSLFLYAIDFWLYDIKYETKPVLLLLSGSVNSQKPVGFRLPSDCVLRTQYCKLSQRPVATYSLLVGQQMQSRGSYRRVWTEETTRQTR